MLLSRAPGLAVARGDHLERLIWPYLRFAICVPRDCPTIAEAFTEIPDCCPVAGKKDILEMLYDT